MKYLFYGFLIIAGVAVIFYLWDMVLTRRDKAIKKQQEDAEKTDLKILAFLQSDDCDYSLSNIRNTFSPEQVSSLLSRKGILNFFLDFGKHEDIAELVTKTDIKKNSPLTLRMLLNSLVKDERTFTALREAYGEQTSGKLLSNSIHYQAYIGSEPEVLRLVERGMSDDVGQDQLYAASLLWFGVHSRNKSIVEALLRLGNVVTKHAVDHDGNSEIMLACEIGDEKTIDLVFRSGVSRKEASEGAETFFHKIMQRDFRGDFILKYAKILAADGFSFNPAPYEALLKEKNIWKDILEVFPMKPEEPMISGIQHQLAKHDTKFPAPYVSLGSYFDDLIGYEKLKDKLEFELGDWLSREPRTRLKLFWGPSCNGKTELCLRLTGLKQGFRPPVDFGAVHYITPTNLSAIGDVLQGPQKSLILVDDFHTVSDRQSSVNYNSHLHKDFLIQLKTVVSVTNHFWIFLVKRKPASEPSESEIFQMFGEDIGGYVDYQDWTLPRWGIWELARYVDTHTELSRYFDEEGLANIVSRLHSKGMGPKEMNRLVTYANTFNSNDKLKLNQVLQILDKIGA